MYTQRWDGIALQSVVKGPGYESARYGYVNNIDTSTILGDDLLKIFLVNRSIREAAEIEIDHGRGRLVSVISAEIVSGPSPDSCNTYENPYVISNQPLQTVKISEGKANVEIPPLSVAAITFGTA